VPMCLKQHGAIVTGIGEKIETFESLPQSNIVLVNPNRPVLTADVFKSLKGEFNAKAVTPFGATSTKDYFNWLSIHSNDLAPAAEDLCRDIKKIREVLERQKGQGYLGMSGSGATCFALFENERDTRKAARKIKRENPNWWVKKGLINKR